MKGVALKNVILTLAMFFSFLSKGSSIGEITQVGARDVSLGNATVALISSFSVFNNQASLAWAKGVSLAIDYRQPYLIERFSQKSLAATVPTQLCIFGIGIQQKGIAGYNESRFGFAMAKTLGNRFSAGIQFNCFVVDFPEQGSSLGTFLVEFGALFRTKNDVSIGIHIFNPSGTSIQSLNFQSEFPVYATIGIALKPSPELLFVSSAAWGADKPFNIGLGIEYQFADSFYLRGGVSGKPVRHSAGLGYKCRYFATDVAFVHHETLGYTPSISLIFNF